MTHRKTHALRVAVSRDFLTHRKTHLEWQCHEIFWPLWAPYELFATLYMIDFSFMYTGTTTVSTYTAYFHFGGFNWTLYSRLEWFWKNTTLPMLCQIVVGSQFQNFMSLCCLFACRRSSENVECYPKLSKVFYFYFYFLKVAPETKFVLKHSKNGRETKKIMFRFNRTKTVLPNFGK